MLGSLENGPRRMTERFAEHGVRLPAMTAQINRLERDGLVARGLDGSAARVVTGRLTPAGTRAAGFAGRAHPSTRRRTPPAMTDGSRCAAAALPALDKPVRGSAPQRRFHLKRPGPALRRGRALAGGRRSAGTLSFAMRRYDMRLSSSGPAWWPRTRGADFTGTDFAGA